MERKENRKDKCSFGNSGSFIIYNIPQLAGVALTVPLMQEMKKNPNVAGVKNSSMPVQDIQMFKMYGGEDFAVFNGPDEQLVSGLVMGADGGIGDVRPPMPRCIEEDMPIVKEAAAMIDEAVKKFI